MKFLFSPDSFKGSLSAQRVTELLEIQAQKVFPGCETISLPLADGGEGTLDILIRNLKGTFQTYQVNDPLFKSVPARIGLLPPDIAVIELSAASGLPLIPKNRRDPALTSTYGTGELIRAAIEAGRRHIIIGLGGSATNDGGVGIMAALGVQFRKKDGTTFIPTGGTLKQITSIDDSKLYPLVKDCSFQIMCDVENPFLGPKGATRVFAKQKGADEQMIKELELGMCHLERLLYQKYGIELGNTAGAGAAGGAAGSFLAFLHAEKKSGIQTILELLNYEKMLEDKDIVITGEGCVDGQSADGKVLWGVGKYCKAHQIPVIAIAGCVGKGVERIYECGIDGIITTTNGIMSSEYAMEHAESLFSAAAYNMFSMIKTGTKITNKKERGK